MGPIRNLVGADGSAGLFRLLNNPLANMLNYRNLLYFIVVLGADFSHCPKQF